MVGLMVNHTLILQDSLLQILVFEGTYLKLLDYNSKAVLSKQNILTVRRWGVGSDDVRLVSN